MSSREQLWTTVGCLGSCWTARSGDTAAVAGSEQLRATVHHPWLSWQVLASKEPVH